MTINGLICDWNASLDAANKQVDAANLEIMALLQQGKISTEAAAVALEPKRSTVKDASASWCRWWMKEWGWSMLSRGSDTQTWLPYDHIDMAHARTTTKELFSKQVLNFDQLWRCAYAFGGKLLYKARSSMSKRTHRTKAPRKMDKKLHTIKGSRRSVTVPLTNWSRESLANIEAVVPMYGEGSGKGLGGEWSTRIVNPHPSTATHVMRFHVSGFEGW